MIKALRRFYSFFVYLFLYAPIVVMMVYSFNGSKYRTQWGGFSLKWYKELFGDEKIIAALQTTLIVAGFSAVIATVIGTMAAYALFNMKPLSKGLAMNVTYLPILNPDIVTGVSLMILFIFMGVPRGYYTLLLAHVTFNVPYVILSVLPKLKQLDKNLYEAALDLGASPFYAFWRVVMPQIMPGIITGFLLAFTLSIDDFVISFFTTGPGVSNLSILIYSMARKGIKPEINALSTLMFFVVLLLLLLVNYRMTGEKKTMVKEQRI